MAAFTLFPRLAPELRAMIWKEALDEEADDRIALVHGDETLRNMPFKSLISPLLSTNQESRKLALLRYSFKLDVVSVSVLDPITAESVEAWASNRDDIQWGVTPMEDIKQKYWDSYKEFRCYVGTRKTLCSPIGDLGRKNGCIRLSLETDKFLLAYNVHNKRRWKDGCIAYLMRDEKAEFLGSAGLEFWRTNIFTQLNNPVRGRFMALSIPTTLCMSDEEDGLRILDTAAEEGAKSMKFIEWRREDDISDSWGWSLTGPFEV
ncbi:hypothetical protein PGQ11_010491 [Apiospora arundinis]|uniref:2EXR domain-containing protein n=1 Tax=Apiospora arundinis TaxID=335852 RepID=A0ABR2I9U0_9PEZI